MPARSLDLTALSQLQGQEIGTSDWLTVSQDMIDAFAQVTGDRQWIHVDVERARQESPFGGTVAHGFLTLALVSRLHFQAVQVEGDFRQAINYGLNKVRFPAPVPAGARVRGRSMLLALEDRFEFVQLSWQITVEIEGQNKPALVAEWLLRLYRQ
jgi:acyl dehydratase